MSENKDQKNINPNENLEKRMKEMEKTLSDLKMITIANLYGNYNDDVEDEISAEIKDKNITSKGGFLKKYFQIMFLLFSLAILLFSFMTFAAVTGKGIDTLKKAGIKIDPLSETLAVTGVNPNAPKGPKIVETSIDDDPVLGNKDAPVTIVEFSDYDCPFCRVFNETTYKEIKKTYIDTGKAKFVYRDLPIKQLHPLAFEKAVAINCAREQGGDETYYKYHDALFELAGKMQASPNKEDLKKLALGLNLNANQFNGCLDSGKYDNEISMDIADAVKIDAFGTPTFIIGKTNGDGSVKGELIEGAAPFSEYQRVIDELLK